MKKKAGKPLPVKKRRPRKPREPREHEPVVTPLDPEVLAGNHYQVFDAVRVHLRKCGVYNTWRSMVHELLAADPKDFRAVVGKFVPVEK